MVSVCARPECSITCKESRIFTRTLAFVFRRVEGMYKIAMYCLCLSSEPEAVCSKSYDEWLSNIVLVQSVLDECDMN